MRFAVAHAVIAASIAAAAATSAGGRTKRPFGHRPALGPAGWTSQRRTAAFSEDARPVRRTIRSALLILRGGDDADAMTVAAESTTTDSSGAEKTLDEKVREAMRKLGIEEPKIEEEVEEAQTAEVEKPDGVECEGGVCKVPPPPPPPPSDVAGTATVKEEAVKDEASPKQEEDDDGPTNFDEAADDLALELGVDRSIALAALGASATYNSAGEGEKINVSAARAMIRAELDAMGSVAEDCEEVKQLVSEGHDPFLTRRALAFAEMNVDDARAILIADEEDEEAERREAHSREEEEARAKIRAEAEQRKKEEAAMKTVKVDANFDPTNPGGMGMGGAGAAAAPGAAAQQQQMPPPAKKEDVVFDATSSEIQKLVMESPVPVLLDVYADWCGPCKALTPALEQMAVKAGGIFRLVKINTDNERPVSAALEVTSLPTVFGIRDGKIVHMFQGMPRDEAYMRNFMMGLLTPGGTFDPPVTNEQKKKYAELSSKLAKTAGAASFSFAAREVLQDRTHKALEGLVDECGGDMVRAEESARILRTLLSNAIRDPYDAKFRTVNLENKVISDKVAKYPSCLSILRSAGFVQEKSGDGGEGAGTMVLGKGKKTVNVAPLAIVRDAFDKWIDRNRYRVAAAARKRKDEADRARLAEEGAFDSEEYDEEEEDVDPDACSIKLRLDGKKKVHELNLRADDPLSVIVDNLPGPLVGEGEEVQITCAARRLVVKSTDAGAMAKTLRDHRLHPAAAVVVKVGSPAGAKAAQEGEGIAERAAKKSRKKKGSHTMQSVGIYAKDDNLKGELIDGGGGTLFEHDVTDTEDEAEEEEPQKEEEGEDENGAYDEYELEQYSEEEGSEEQ